MVPAHYVQLPGLPLTTNGKVDRKRLPAAGGNGMPAASEYVAPRNQTEEKLAAIWQEILAKDRIGIRDNFFDLGGDSIKILRMMAALRRGMNLEVPNAEVYRHNTIESLLGHIESNQQEISRQRTAGKKQQAMV